MKWSTIPATCLLLLSGAVAWAQESAGLLPAGRLPFLAVGEVLDKPIEPRRLAKVNQFEARPSTHSVTPGQIIPWHQAQQHVGQTLTVEGTIVLARNTGNVCFLNYSKDWRGKFYVILFEDVLKSWPQPPEKYFLNKKIRVTGEIAKHKGSPQIQVRDARQITILKE